MKGGKLRSTQRVAIVFLLALLVVIPLGLAPAASASTGSTTYVIATEGETTASGEIISANPCPSGWKGVIIGIGDDTQVLWACTNLIP